uniref:Beta-defensin 118 beta n=1 Tax=Garrulax canorus TaxID=238855 RepID=A0A3G1AZU4_9PASS|nr:beta-defensin 118 beta [Garrulax canorus]
MKILFLLFPLILLLVQGASAGCRQRGGRCTYGRCNFPERPIGRCTLYSVCCKR